ncbi:hypothetical protein Tco_1054579 [Tanacetum coccineum]|uniref:Uncharacterized protein n=1 Tax=Tanacetum coccineum TaxID=301880 RepID=A0ABQ5GX63_9ASTR
MDPNKSNEERNYFSEVDDETDICFMMQACEYNQRLEEEQNRPRLTDYFDDFCKYPLYYFRRRYRMSRKLFLDIVEGIRSYTVDPLPKHFKFFTVQPDATGRMSLSVIMKCTSVIRRLAYDNTSDAFDEYLKMSEHTARMLGCIDCMHWEWKIVTIVLEDVASHDLYQSRRGIRVPKKWRSSYSIDVIFFNGDEGFGDE